MIIMTYRYVLIVSPATGFEPTDTDMCGGTLYLLHHSRHADVVLINSIRRLLIDLLEYLLNIDFFAYTLDLSQSLLHIAANMEIMA